MNRKSTGWALAACVLLATAAAAAPAIQPWDRQSSVLWADTLSHNRAGATTDSMTISDSVSVTGARAIYITAVSDGNDTLLVSGTGALAVQFKAPGGNWSSLSAMCIGAPTPNQSFITNTTKVNNQAVTVYTVAMTDAGSGTPYPANVAMMRVRVKSGDTRDWQNASAATGAGMTGKFTITAHVWR